MIIHSQRRNCDISTVDIWTRAENRHGGKVGSNRVGFVAALLVFHSANGLQAGLSIKLQIFNQGHGQKNANLDLLILG